MLENENIIIFSSDDWSSGLKTSKYHIAVRLAKKNKVLFVNSIGMRNPQVTAKDLKRIWSKLKRFVAGCEKVGENLFVFTPIVIPFHNVKLFERINQWILSSSLKRIQKRLSLSDPVSFIFTPVFVNALDAVLSKKVIYYCIDELSAYKGVDQEKLDQMERSLFIEADLVITCSKKLLELKKGCHHNVHYVPHGVDWALFSKAVNEDLPMPDDMKGITHPVVGYYGFLSDDWIDEGLLLKLADARPDISIVLIGRIKAGFMQQSDKKNIHFLGIKPFETLPAYTKAFDIGIIPFTKNDLTLSSNPLKLYEYLSGGLKVVSVDIPEVRRFQSMIEIAETADDFIIKIDKVLSQDSENMKHALSEAMKKEDWNQRLEDISLLINNLN